MPYTPIHDRPPYYASPPTPPSNSTYIQRYASPDLDPTRPLNKMSDGESNGHEQGQEVGPSRKRPRQEEQEYGHEVEHGSRRGYERIIPSMFGLSARNEFTKTIGEFIMANARGLDHVEIEIKLGTLMTPTQAGQPHRVRIPTMSEAILPSDYPIGNFSSTMSKKQNINLNNLLNTITSESHKPPPSTSDEKMYPIKFYRARHIDTFYNISSTGRGGGKIRVSRDRDGNVVPGGIVRKRRIGDLNVTSPRSAFDWRISINTEEPTEMPTGQPASTREKDRACYRHQLCQVDLTVVTTRGADGPPTVTYELEIEILDVPALIAAGEDPNPDRFDEMLQSILDTARMLIRNV